MPDGQIGDWVSHKTGQHDQSMIGKNINYRDYNKNPGAYGAVQYNNNSDNVNYKDYNKSVNNGGTP